MTKSRSFYCFFVSCCFTILYERKCSGHVALTFPPARPYAIDFLDNVRTAGPCGMPRGLGKPLSLLAGATYIFTWNMPNLHPGGIRLELLDRDYNLLETLAPVRGEVPSGQFFGNFSDPTTIYRQVTIPNLECTNCVVRLMRTAGEWAPGADIGYMFRSCADVNVVRREKGGVVTARDVCSNNGAYNVSQRQCRCDRSFAGSSCQHEQECSNDADCSLNGKCLSTDSVSFPRQQCYCSPGFFGIHCESKSAIDVNDIVQKRSAYKVKQMPNGFELMWRLLPELQELEVVVRANTLSWVGLGIRSAGATVACRNFPQLPVERVVNLEAYYDKGIGKHKQLRRRDPPPWLQRQQPPLVDADLLHPMDCNDIVWGAAKEGTLSRVRDMYTRERAMPHVDEFFGGKQSLTGATAFEREGVTTMIFRRRLTSDHPTDVAIVNAPMHVIMAHGQSPDTNPLPELHSDDDGNPFQEQINFNSISSSLSIKNFYRLDELKYHGVDFMQRGFTQINFLAGAPPLTTVLRKPAEVVQQPQIQRPAFAGNDAIRPLSTPATTMTVKSQNLPCFGQFRMPENCVTSGSAVSDKTKIASVCQYAAEWYYDAALKALRVQLFSSQPNKWLGIGWSKTGEMTNSDIATAWISSKNLKQITVTDRFALGHFMPAKDLQQNLRKLSGRRIADQSVMVEFAKPLTSGDTKGDHDLTDSSCFYMLYPVDGGSYNEVDECFFQQKNAHSDWQTFQHTDGFREKDMLQHLYEP